MGKAELQRRTGRADEARCLQFTAELISAKLEVDAAKLAHIKNPSGACAGPVSSQMSWLESLIKGAATRLGAAACNDSQTRLAQQFRDSWDGILSEFEPEQIDEIGRILIAQRSNIIHSVMLLG